MVKSDVTKTRDPGPDGSDQRAHKRRLLPGSRRVVVKIGSSLLTTGRGIEEARLHRLADEVGELRAGKRQVVVVSSGAVAAGMARLDLEQKPRTIRQRQAAAAVGQIGLMAMYERCFGVRGLIVAQVLLTHDDLAARRRHLNARHTFEELLGAGVVPVVNENDTVADEEMRFGDNDNLCALVATLISADLLVILSDVDGLFTGDPRVDGSARLIPVVGAINEQVLAHAGSSGGPVGTGGMATKLQAARKATAAGIPCVVADGRSAGVLAAVFDPDRSVGTLFLPKGDRLSSRKHWIAHTLNPAGAITVDAGARDAIVGLGRSLLPRGIVMVNGSFRAGACVSCLGPDGLEFARGLVAYGSAELAEIKGMHSNAIEGRLGYRVSNEAIHRDDLVVLS
jgi:glutamate 5-kinase